MEIISILNSELNDMEALKKIEPKLKKIFDSGRLTGYQDAITLLINQSQDFTP